MVEEAVLNYLKTANRPFSANDIHGNLQSYSKKDVTHTLEVLVETNKIITKAYGKQNIYFINQDLFGDVKDTDIKEVEDKTKELYTSIEQLTMDLNEKRAEILRRKEILPMEEIEKRLADLKNEIEDLNIKIKSNSSCQVEPEKLKEIQNAHTKMNKEANRRKRITKEAFNMILENYEGSKKSLLEELDIDIV